jgi:hypothetical protein
MPWRHIGEGRYSSTILGLGTRWGMSGQLHAPAALPSRKLLRYPLDMRQGASQNRYESLAINLSNFVTVTDAV